MRASIENLERLVESEAREVDDAIAGGAQIEHDEPETQPVRARPKPATCGRFEVNPKTGASIWDADLEAMYGLPAGTFGRTQAAWISMLHPADRREVVEYFEESLKAGRDTDEWHARIVRPDGSVRHMVGSWQVFRDETGEAVRITGINYDVTERAIGQVG